MAKNAPTVPTSTPSPVVGIVPRSVLALGPEQVEIMARIQQAEMDRRASLAALDDLVARFRALGAPWSAVGAAVGTSGEAARQRWGT